MIDEEFGALAPEYTLPEPEQFPLPPEYEAGDTVSFPPPKRSSLAEKMKAYLLTAAIGVTAVTSAAVVKEVKEKPRPPAPVKTETVVVSAADYVAGHELAFYALSGDDAERMAERELWNLAFSGEEPMFGGIFEDENALARSFKRDTVYYTDMDGILGLPYYNYSFELPESAGGTVSGRIYILAERGDVIARLRFKGETWYHLIPAGTDELRAPYDATLEKDGKTELEYYVFGNGAEAAYMLTREDAEKVLTLRCTSMHSGDAGVEPIDRVISIVNASPPKRVPTRGAR